METFDERGDFERGYKGGRERREGVKCGGGRDFSCGREEEDDCISFNVRKRMRGFQDSEANKIKRFNFVGGNI